MNSHFLLFLVILILGFISIQGIRMQFLLKMGIRNLKRRKVNTLIVVLGLMIGTAIISGSLVVGDTLENMFTKGVYDSYHETDEVIFSFDQNGSYAFFNYTTYLEIKQFAKNNPQLSNKIEGFSPEINVPVSVFNLNTKLSEPAVTLVGFDYNESKVFGDFKLKKGGTATGEELAPDEAFVNEMLAEEIDLKDGHRLMVFYGENQSVIFKVTVVKNEGRALFGWGYGIGSGYNIFIPLERAQTLLGKEGKINYIKISNVGGVKDGMKKSQEVEEALAPYLYSKRPVLLISKVKQEAIERAVEGSKSLRDLFMVMGTFTIIAGMMLVINIFVMLAEERKSEMGIARAVGMKRKHLMYMFLFEGTAYSLLSALVGSFVGLGVAVVIIYAFAKIFITESDFNPMQFFTFSVDSLILAFCGGLLITLFTIYISSRKVSKLNIIRAIRNIPEPHYQRHEMSVLAPDISFLKKLKIKIYDLVLRHYEILLTVLGIFLVFSAFVNLSEAMYHKEWAGYGGLSLAIYGFTLLLRRWYPDKWAFSFGGTAVFLLWALPFDHYQLLFGVKMHGQMEMFVISGLFLVSSALMVIMYNHHLILNTLTRMFGWIRGLAPIFKTAVSYPMSNRFRTGMTLAIFSLIIFTITVLAMIMGLIEGNIDQLTEEQSGGYDLVATNNPLTPFRDLRKEIEENENLSLQDFKKIVPLYTSFSLVYGVSGGLLKEKRNEIIEKNLTRPFGEFQEDADWYNIIGCTEQFFKESDYQLDEWNEKEFKDYKDVWKAVKENDSLAIIDITVKEREYGPPREGLALKVGDFVVIRDSENHSKVVKVVGVTKQGIIRGIFVNENVVRKDLETESSYITLFKFSESLSSKEKEKLAKKLESEMVAYGMQTFLIEKEIRDSLRMMKNFFSLLESFLGLGLVVGIAGLGIITIKSVTERRQQIGMLRAIGFRQRMVHLSFLLESSFIALLGIFLGVVLGIILSVRIWLDGFEDVAFVIPWKTIIIISLVSYFFTFISTYGPSKRAAKIPPAEALRYVG